MTTPHAAQVGAQAGVRAGDVLAGKYRVERILGVGGMGVVVAAHHLQLDEKVALKFLLPNALQNAEAVSRFVREARAAVKIKGEHVARVSDVGQLANGSPYIVMEYLDGIDLAAWLAAQGPLPVELAVDFVLQACEAMAEAHGLGIVHRDLKPSNLFCIRRRDGGMSIKVLDFGISKVTSTEALAMTRTSALFGSPFYMSPEQMQSSKTVDARADIWSLGVILFELVTGARPFHGESITDLAIKVATTAPAPLSSRRPNCPAGLEQTILRCLDKDRERRFHDVGELAIALKDFGSRAARGSVERVLGLLREAGISQTTLSPSGETRIPVPIPRPGSAPITISPWGQTDSGRKGPGGAIAVIAAISMTVALVVTAILVLHASAPSSAMPASAAAVAPAEPTQLSASPSASLPPPDPSTLPVVATTAAASAAPSAVPEPAASADPGVEPPPSGAIAHPATHATAAAGTTTSTGRPSASAPPVPKAICSPNYTLDSDGNKHFKPECFGHEGR